MTVPCGISGLKSRRSEAGPEIINFTHWLGAVITNYDVIGAGYTPVRAVIDRAAELIPRPRSCFAFVVTHEGVAGLYVSVLLRQPAAGGATGEKLPAI